MKLPDAENATVDRERIVAYLLNPGHPDNGGKAAFFELLGFRRSDWQPFAEALRQLAREQEVSKRVKSAHGTKFVLDGIIAGPAGRAGSVRTI